MLFEPVQAAKGLSAADLQLLLSRTQSAYEYAKTSSFLFLGLGDGAAGLTLSSAQLCIKGLALWFAHGFERVSMILISRVACRSRFLCLAGAGGGAGGAVGGAAAPSLILSLRRSVGLLEL